MTLFDKFVAELRLAGFTDQWITNHISINEQNDGEVQFSFNYFSAPILKRLSEFSIASKLNTVEYAHTKFSDLHHFSNFPKLHTLHLRYYYFIPLPVGGSSRRRVDRKVELPQIPQLQKLEIEEIYPEELARLDFSRLPNLSYLKITINASLATTIHHTTFPPLYLENLKGLSIKYVGTLDLHPSILELPNLNFLEIKVTNLHFQSRNLLEQLHDRGVEILLQSW